MIILLLWSVYACFLFYILYRSSKIGYKEKYPNNNALNPSPIIWLPFFKNRTTLNKQQDHTKTAKPFMQIMRKQKQRLYLVMQNMTQSLKLEYEPSLEYSFNYHERISSKGKFHSPIIHRCTHIYKGLFSSPRNTLYRV